MHVLRVQNYEKIGTPQNFCELFHCQQVIILLTLLCQKVFAVDKVFSSNGSVLIGQLLFVQADAAALNHLAHLALGGEDGGNGGEELDSGLAQLAGARRRRHLRRSARRASPSLPWWLCRTAGWRLRWQRRGLHGSEPSR